MLPRLVRIVIALVCLFACGWVIRAAGLAGLSGLYASYATKGAMLPDVEPETLLAAAEKASSLTPSDAEAFRARGVARLAINQPAEAAAEFAHSTTLRPRHYLLWIELGRARDRAGDMKGAIEALKEAARLAPYFAQPRWQLGNVLFRAQLYDEAFAEIRRAVAGDPKLLPLALELAWVASGGDPKGVEQLLHPTGASARLAFARFLARHDNAAEAIDLFRTTGGISEADQRALVAELMAAKKFPAAYEVWASGRTDVVQSNHGVAAITNGSFENNITANDPGFGWRVNKDVQGTHIKWEKGEAKDGARSLCIEWNGNSNPSAQLLTQFVVVEPNTQYRLHFYALTRELISGGLPSLVVSDASGSNSQTLGQTAAIRGSEGAWGEVDLEFKTGEQTESVFMSLQRQPCNTELCPIFGSLWLDGFSIEKI